MASRASQKRNRDEPRAARSPGRPAGKRRPLSRARIEDAALRLLERGGPEAFSMRGLAGKLRVDPMALYHYYPDRKSLLRAAGLTYYRSFRVDFKGLRSWTARLDRLAAAYLEFIAGSPALVRFLAGDPESGVAAAALITPYFEEAVRDLALTPARRRDLLYLYFDFLHGHALGPAPDYRGALDILIAGAVAVTSAAPAARRATTSSKRSS